MCQDSLKVAHWGFDGTKRDKQKTPFGKKNKTKKTQDHVEK